MSPVTRTAGTTHYWWVKPNNGGWVGPMSFTPTGAAITQLGPSGTITTLTPTYSWTAGEGTSSYEVWVSTTTSGVPIINRTTTTGTSLVSPVTLTAATIYHWWVKPDNGGWVGPMSFTTQGAQVRFAPASKVPALR